LWWIFFVLGMGTLLPWNFFITPYQYWIDKLDDSSTQNQTTNETYNFYQNFWSSALAVTTMGTNFTMCFITTLLMNVVSRNTRFYVPMAGIGVCFGIAAVMTQMDSSTWVPLFFTTTLVNVIIITIFCAIFQASLFGHAAEVGEVTSAVMAGQGAGGVFACAVDIVSKLTIDSLPDAVCMYFVIAVIFMVISAIAYRYMQPMALYQHRLDKASDISAADELKLKDGEETKLMDNEVQQETAFQAIRRAVWPYHLTLVLTFTVTLSIFPGVVSSYRSVNFEEGHPYYEKFFTTIWVFLNFNVFDFLGRYLSEKACDESSPLNVIKKNEPFKLVICSLCRFIFIPLFMKCNVSKADGGTVFAYFKYDSVFIVFMALMSFTNGFFSSLAMVYGPQAAPEHVRGQVGGYLGTTLVGGLLCGALLSFALVPLAKVL